MSRRTPLDGSPLAQLTLWRIREFTREPEALFWVFAFPIVLAFALGLAFKSKAPDMVQVAVEEGQGASDLVTSLSASSRIEAILLDSSEADNRLRTGRVAMVVRPGRIVSFKYDSTRTESLVARLVVDDALQEARGRRDVAEIRDVPARVLELGDVVLGARQAVDALRRAAVEGLLADTEGRQHRGGEDAGRGGPGLGWRRRAQRRDNRVRRGHSPLRSAQRWKVGRS